LWHSQPAKDLKGRDVKAIHPDMTVRDAAQKMREGDFRMMPCILGRTTQGTP
jgi:CBS domain-containing protein